MNEMDACLHVSLEEKEGVCRQSSHLFQHFSHFIDVIIILGILDKMSLPSQASWVVHMGESLTVSQAIAMTHPH